MLFRHNLASQSLPKTLTAQIWETYVELGDTAYRTGNHELSNKMLQAALNEANSTVETESSLGSVLANLASIYCQQERFKKAEILFGRALETQENVFGKNSPHLVSTLNSLAGVLILDGKLQQAERLYKRAFAITKKTYGPGDKRLIPCLIKLVEFYTSTNEFEKAGALVNRIRRLQLAE